MDLATLMQQASLLNQQSLQQGQEIAGLMQGASSAASESSKVLQQSSNDIYESELTALEGQLKAQQQRVQIANAYGTNVGAQSDVITPLAETMRQTAIQLTNAQARVSEIEAGSDLLGNPLGWLKDLVVGDGARAERDALASQVEQQSKTAHALNAATQSSIQTVNAIDETLTATSIKQVAAAKAAIVQVRANDATIEAARLGAAGIETLMQVGAQNFSRNMSMYNAQQQDESMALARQERADRMKDRKDAESDLQEVTDNINAYNKMYGRPEVPTSLVKRYWGAAGQVGEDLRKADLAGFKIRQTGGSEGTLGVKPSDAYMEIASGNITTPAAWKPGRDVLDQAEAEFNSFLGERDKATGKTNRELLKGPQLQAKYDEMVGEIATRSQGRIVHGTGNPYQVPPIEAVLKSPTAEGKALAASPYRKFVLDSLVATGIPDPSPEQLMAVAASAVERGDISAGDAVRWGVQYFREGHALKAATGGFTTLNIPIADTYKVSLDYLNKPVGKTPIKFFGLATVDMPTYSPEQESLHTQGKKIMDLKNPADFTTAFMVMMAQRKAKQITENLTGTNQ